MSDVHPFVRRSRFPWLLAAVLSSVGSASLHAENPVQSGSTLLTIAAEGVVRQPPDLAHLTASVITGAADADTAIRDNAARMERVFAAARGAGIADRDTRTQQVNVSPQYRTPSPVTNNNPITITGYRASNTVRFTVRDLTRLGRVLDAVIASGANQVYGPAFEVEFPEPVRDRARVAALDVARQRAVVYANALGLSVRRVVSIEEGGPTGSGTIRPMAEGLTASAEAPPSPVGDTPVGNPPSGELPFGMGAQTFRTRLMVVFELGNSADAP